jgi:hypothetical protein
MADWLRLLFAVGVFFYEQKELFGFIERPKMAKKATGDSQ